MAITKAIENVSLSIETQSGVDKAGDPIFIKKSFSGLRCDAAIENVYEVAEAIKGILEANTRCYLLNETSTLINKQ